MLSLVVEEGTSNDFAAFLKQSLCRRVLINIKKAAKTFAFFKV